MNNSIRFSIGIILVVCAECLALRGADLNRSIARIWDEEILSAIRIDLPNPPVHARNLFHLSAAMYDAWAVYDPVAVGYLYRDKQKPSDLVAARREAISYAAYRILTERCALSRNASNTLAALEIRMVAQGYDPHNLTRDPSTPAGVGNLVAAAVSSSFLNDGAFQSQAYRDLPISQGGYAAVNPPLITGAPGTLAVDVNHWQPLVITNATSQNNIPLDLVQKFLGAQWLGVRPFCLTREDSSLPWLDPGPPPRLGVNGDAQFRAEIVDLIQRSSELTPDDGVVSDISPGSLGNNTLGENDGHGHAINPTTGEAYLPNLVKRGDFARALAEFWADGPSSETPPGHWNMIANSLSDHPDLKRKIGGRGPEVDPLEWDVKNYLALNAALHDAACAAWSLKRFYDGGRPIAYVRFMAQLGQSSDPGQPLYHHNGLPLVPGLIEIVRTETAQPGERHFGIPLNTIAIRAWSGVPPNPTTEHGGVHWIAAASWFPYQKKTFVTPAFPGFVSGHSTFSRAAAEVLTAFTGSQYFPNGLGTSTVSALSFEQGPTAPVQLQWATYYDAADQAGLSRLWGGIHVSADDLTGRRLGAKCGQAAWNLARQYFDGSITGGPGRLQVVGLPPDAVTLRFPTVRGFFYKIQSSPEAQGIFFDDSTGYRRAIDSYLMTTQQVTGSQKFFRVFSTASP